MAKWVVTKHIEGVGPWLPLPEGLDLTYYEGGTEIVNVNTPTFYALGDLPYPLPKLWPKGKRAPGINPTPVYDDDGVKIGVTLWTFEPVEAPTPSGGVVLFSVKDGVALALVDTKPIKFAKMHALLQAESVEYGVLDDLLDETLAYHGKTRFDMKRIGMRITEEQMEEPIKL